MPFVTATNLMLVFCLRYSLSHLTPAPEKTAQICANPKTRIGEGWMGMCPSVATRCCCIAFRKDRVAVSIGQPT